MIKSVLAVAGALFLAGCASGERFATITDGACKAFEAPEHEIRGRTRHDDAWIAKQTEAGVTGCGWERPKPRPLEWDRAAVAAKPVEPPKKKPSIWSRLRQKS